MGENKDKSFSGRKVFFINPNLAVENSLIARLQTMEYEVYTIKDYRTAKNLFAKIKEGICFVSPDSVLNKNGWRNFIKYFENDETYKDFDFGVLSEMIPENKKEEFTKDLKLSAGFFSTLGNEDTVRNLVKSLDKLEAKGMRKYIRVSCLADTKSELYWFTKDKKMFRCKLIDLSTAGIAAKLPLSQAKAVFVNQLISDATLVLAGKQLPVCVKVSGIKAANDVLLVIMMYGMDTPVSTQNQIRSYVNEKLKLDLEWQMRDLAPDKTKYETKEK